MAERRQYSKITLYKSAPSGLFSPNSVEQKGSETWTKIGAMKKR